MKSFLTRLASSFVGHSKEEVLHQSGVNSLPKDILRIFATTANAKVVYSLTTVSKIVSSACLAPHFKRHLQESHTTYTQTGGPQVGDREGVHQAGYYTGRWPNRNIVYGQHWITSGPYQGTITRFLRIIDYDKYISVEEAFYNNGSPEMRSFTKGNRYDGLCLRWVMMQNPHIDFPKAPLELGSHSGFPILSYRVKCIDGYKEGVEEEFYGSGSIAMISHWVHGVREGPQITYSLDGRVIKQVIWRNGCPLN